jgi:hypothetical protein
VELTPSHATMASQSGSAHVGRGVSHGGIDAWIARGDGRGSGTGGDYAPGGGSAAPTSPLTYGNPTSNDTVTVGFRQTIGANEPLRTGSYSKTLTFTLSTTAP